MKKKLLIVAHHMTVGGVQKTLISASKAIDYDRYDVTLYLRKNRTDLLSLVDGRMNVIINKDPNRYYRKPFALILQAASVVSKHFVAVVEYPLGKPITVQIATLSPTYSLACFTKEAGIQHDAQEYFIPSSKIALISSQVAL